MDGPRGALLQGLGSQLLPSGHCAHHTQRPWLPSLDPSYLVDRQRKRDPVHPPKGDLHQHHDHTLLQGAGDSPLAEYSGPRGDPYVARHQSLSHT